MNSRVAVCLDQATSSFAGAARFGTFLTLLSLRQLHTESLNVLSTNSGVGAKYFFVYYCIIIYIFFVVVVLISHISAATGRMNALCICACAAMATLLFCIF